MKNINRLLIWQWFFFSLLCWRLISYWKSFSTCRLRIRNDRSNESLEHCSEFYCWSLCVIFVWVKAHSSLMIKHTHMFFHFISFASLIAYTVYQNNYSKLQMTRCFSIRINRIASKHIHCLFWFYINRDAGPVSMVRSVLGIYTFLQLTQNMLKHSYWNEKKKCPHFFLFNMLIKIVSSEMLG